ncbi:hypothetical protein, partial [Pseudomonas aeruginosa]
HQGRGLSFELGGKRTSLLAHQAPLSRQGFSPKSVSGISRPLQMPFNMTNENPFIPSAREWRAGDTNAKRNILGYAFGAVSLVVGIVPLLVWLLEPRPQPPVPSAYELSESRRADFLELLRVPPGAKLDIVRIGCTTWSEESCITAGKFLKLFSEAGWQIDGAQVFSDGTFGTGRWGESSTGRAYEMETEYCREIRNDSTPAESKPPPLTETADCYTAHSIATKNLSGTKSGTKFHP